MAGPSVSSTLTQPTMLKELKKEITINFGKPCKTKSCLCACCVAWSAYNTLEELFSLKTK